jgi:hypothetical protein
MSESQAHRHARNEVQHRELNERLAEYDSEAGFASLPLDFVCECFRESCRVHLELTADSWQRLHLEPEQFVVAPGHVDTQREEVVLRTSTYWQVRKIREAGDDARRLSDDR